MPTSNPPLIHLQVPTAHLRAALGPTGRPATLAFTPTAMTVTTPAGSRRIAARVVTRHVCGVHTAGLRPADADRLRAACGTGATAVLYVRARTITLAGTAAGPVTVGRW